MTYLELYFEIRYWTFYNAYQSIDYNRQTVGQLTWVGFWKCGQLDCSRSPHQQPWWTEKHVAAACPEFSSAYFTTESLKSRCTFSFFYSSAPMVIFNFTLTFEEIQRDSVKKLKKIGQCFYVFFIGEIKQIRPSVYWGPAIICQHTYMHPAFKWNLAVNWSPAIIWNFMVFYDG